MGEASIYLEQLESFLALAEEFELKGFTESSEERASEYIKTKRNELFQPSYEYDLARTNKGTLSKMELENTVFEGNVVPVPSKVKFGWSVIQWFRRAKMTNGNTFKQIFFSMQST